MKLPYQLKSMGIVLNAVLTTCAICLLILAFCLAFSYGLMYFIYQASGL